MTEKPPEYDYIDYTLVRFPSDRLDIGAIRRTHPEFFDVQQARFSEAFEVITDAVDGPNIGSMLRIERLLAMNAFEEVRGAFTKTNTVSDEDKPGFIEELASHYMQYGIASGLQHAQQLILDIEAQAAGQARGGKRPGQGRG